MDNPLLNASFYSMNEILRNLDVKDRFILATTCKTLWNYISQYITIKSTSTLEDCDHLQYVCDLQLHNMNSMKNITDMNNLSKLHIESYDKETITINIIELISNLQNLTELYIYGKFNFINEPLIELNKLQKLELLHVVHGEIDYTNRYSFGGIEHIFNIPNLYDLRLEFHYGEIEILDFTNIHKLNNLYKLTLRFEVNNIKNVDTLSSIGLLNNLYDLDISIYQFDSTVDINTTIDVVQSICKAPNLSKFHLVFDFNEQKPGDEYYKVARIMSIVKTFTLFVERIQVKDEYIYLYTHEYIHFSHDHRGDIQRYNMVPNYQLTDLDWSNCEYSSQGH